VLHYETKPDHENEALKARLVELVHERRRFGYRRLYPLVERDGTHGNHKRVYRLYGEAELAFYNHRCKPSSASGAPKGREHTTVDRSPLPVPVGGSHRTLITIGKLSPCFAARIELDADGAHRAAVTHITVKKEQAPVATIDLGRAMARG
jgi:hypothetical protein